MCQKLKDLWSVMPSSGGEICIQVEPRMCNNRSSKQTRISEEMRESALMLFLWLHFSLRPRGGGVPFPVLTHEHTLTSAPHRERSGLVCGRLLALAGTFLSSFESTSKDKGVSEGIVCPLRGPELLRSAWHNTVRAKTRYHVNTLQSFIFTLSVVTHCLGQLPLKPTTKPFCKELTPY